MKKEVKKEMMDVIKPSESCILKVWQLDDGIYLKQEDRLLRICPQDGKCNPGIIYRPGKLQPGAGKRI